MGWFKGFLKTFHSKNNASKKTSRNDVAQKAPSRLPDPQTSTALNARKPSVTKAVKNLLSKKRKPIISEPAVCVTTMAEAYAQGHQTQVDNVEPSMPQVEEHIVATTFDDNIRLKLELQDTIKREIASTLANKQLQHELDIARTRLITCEAAAQDLASTNASLQAEVQSVKDAKQAEIYRLDLKLYGLTEEFDLVKWHLANLKNIAANMTNQYYNLKLPSEALLQYLGVIHNNLSTGGPVDLDELRQVGNLAYTQMEVLKQHDQHTLELINNAVQVSVMTTFEVPSFDDPLPQSSDPVGVCDAALPYQDLFFGNLHYFKHPETAANGHVGANNTPTPVPVQVADPEDIGADTDVDYPSNTYDGYLFTDKQPTSPEEQGCAPDEFISTSRSMGQMADMIAAAGEEEEDTAPGVSPYDQVLMEWEMGSDYYADIETPTSSVVRRVRDREVPSSSDSDESMSELDLEEADEGVDQDARPSPILSGSTAVGNKAKNTTVKKPLRLAARKVAGVRMPARRMRRSI